MMAVCVAARKQDQSFRILRKRIFTEKPGLRRLGERQPTPAAHMCALSRRSTIAAFQGVPWTPSTGENGPSKTEQGTAPEN